MPSAIIFVLTIAAVSTLCYSVQFQVVCPPGFWGADCQNPCPKECYDNKCQKMKGECFDCIPGYTSPFCNVSCGENCLALCAMNGVCMNCKAGYYGAQCEKPCPENCYGNVCNKVTGQCIDCKSKRLCGMHCERTCPQDCRGNLCYQNCKCFACNEGNTGLYCEKISNSSMKLCVNTISNDGETVNSVCIACQKGYYGSKSCEKQCPPHCAGGKCHPETGSCSSCKVGYHGKMCDKVCPEHCEAAGCYQLSGACTGCKNGYRGPHCTDTCEAGCFGLSCDQRSGDCTYCKETYRCIGSCPNCDYCMLGYYGENCELKCPKNCESGCDATTKHCYGCETGFTGQDCTNPCPKGCNFMGCDQYRGNCLFCENGFYGKEFCDQNCHRNCAIPTKLWVSEYQGMCLRESGMCIECVPGYWGEFCQKTCHKNCKYTCDKQTGHCNGCLGNHITSSEDCTVLENVSACNENCNWKGCPQYAPDECYACVSGYYEKDCSLRCPGHCKFNTCRTVFGGEVECIDGDVVCKHGYWGPQCIKICSQNCGNLGCDFKTGICMNCVDGMYGELCDVTCPMNCLSSCNQSTGDCFTCKPGFHQSQCHSPCPRHCQNNTCDQQTSECTLGFESSNNCPEFCKTSSVKSYCTQGCELGYHGYFCDLQCPQHCLKKVCNRHTGACEAGCEENHYGYFCNLSSADMLDGEESPHYEKGKEHSAKRAENMMPLIKVIVPSVVIPVTLLIIVMIIFVVIYKRRGRKLTASQEELWSVDHALDVLARHEFAQEHSGKKKKKGKKTNKKPKSKTLKHNEIMKEAQPLDNNFEAVKEAQLNPNETGNKQPFGTNETQHL